MQRINKVFNIKYISIGYKIKALVELAIRIAYN